MIICTNCGNHNADADEFCGSCGKFLEWVGQKVEDPKPAEVATPEPEPDAAKAGLFDRVKAAVGMDAASGASGATGGVAGPAVDVDDANDADGGPVAPGTVEPSPPGRDDGAAAEAAARDAAAREAATLAAAEETAREAAGRVAARLEAQEASRRAAEDLSRREAEEAARVAAEAEAAETARRQAEAEAAAAEAARRQRDAEAAEQERKRTEEQVAEAARREAEAEGAEAEAAAAAESERRRVEAEAAAAARAKAESEAAAAEEERRRTEAEAAEAERRQAEADEQRRQADEERRRREAEARADASRRAAALLAQPRPAAPPVDATTPSSASATPHAAGSTAPTATPTSHATAPTAAAPTPTAPRPSVAPAQEPARPKAPPRPATQVHVDEGPKPGDLICTQCQTGNDPTRKFCRRCGNSLAKAVPHKKVPWWKALFSRKARTATAADPESRKAKKIARKDARRAAQYRTRRLMATARQAMFILLVLGVIIPFALPDVRGKIFSAGSDAISSVRDKLFPSFEAVNAVAVNATSATPEHPANLAADLAVNTFWSEGAPAEGVGQSISFSFQGKQDLVRVIITPGATDVGTFLKEPRPKELHISFDNGKSTDVTLKDELKPQTFTLKDAKAVTKVDLSINSVYAGQGGQNTSIAEVEFKRKG